MIDVTDPAWSSISGEPRTVLLAAPRSFCVGVDRAIEMVEYLLAQRGPPMYVRKQIVHNRHVVADLEARGAVFVDELDAVPQGATVVFSAHGVSPAVRDLAARRGLEVVDATCPLTSKVHVEARRFATLGDTVVLVGPAEHEEVAGTLGEAPDDIVLVQTPADVEQVQVDDPTRVSYLTQTTLAVDETAEIIHTLRARFPALQGPGSKDICYATTNRQDALTAIASETDLVLVVGSDNSSNANRFVELCRRQGVPAHLVDDPFDSRPEWLAGSRVIGLSAATSTPECVVDDVVALLSSLSPLTIEGRETTREDTNFSLPPPVRPE